MSVRPEVVAQSRQLLSEAAVFQRRTSPFLITGDALQAPLATLGLHQGGFPLSRLEDSLSWGYFPPMTLRYPRADVALGLWGVPLRRVLALTWAAGRRWALPAKNLKTHLELLHRQTCSVFIGCHFVIVSWQQQRL